MRQAWSQWQCSSLFLWLSSSSHCVERSSHLFQQENFSFFSLHGGTGSGVWEVNTWDVAVWGVAVGRFDTNDEKFVTVEASTSLALKRAWRWTRFNERNRTQAVKQMPMFLILFVLISYVLPFVPTKQSKAFNCRLTKINWHAAYVLFELNWWYQTFLTGKCFLCIEAVYTTMLIEDL